MTRTTLGAKAPLVLSALFAIAAVPFASALDGAAGKEVDSFDAGRGELKITFLGHASLVSNSAAPSSISTRCGSTRILRNSPRPTSYS